MTAVAGFQAAGVACGIKSSGDLDFAFIVSEEPCVAAGVFTTNLVKAAPVLLSQAHLKANPESIRAVVINSGCANAVTGERGMANAQETARYTAEKLGCDSTQVLVMSTGVIGVQLPMQKIKRGVDMALDALGDSWEDAARAIMTTDTRPKLVSQDGATGIAKGAGMIAPNMATMLAVMATDATLPAPDLAAALRKANNNSFNRIVVDGDMSTNDAVFLLSSKRRAIDDTFQASVGSVSAALAREIVQDGEGATKLITVRVQGTDTHAGARRIADTIAASPLVKTAFYGCDPNWGRILAAVGRAGVSLDPNKINLSITVDDETMQLLADGQPLDYDEPAAEAMMSRSEITVEIDCGGDPVTAEWVWTCDLSHDYISINADYRT